MVKQKVAELGGIEVLPHPAYSPDIAPSNYHLFRSLAHYLRGRHFDFMAEVEDGIQDFFASQLPDW